MAQRKYKDRPDLVCSGSRQCIYCECEMPRSMLHPTNARQSVPSAPFYPVLIHEHRGQYRFAGHACQKCIVMHKAPRKLVSETDHDSWCMKISEANLRGSSSKLRDIQHEILDSNVPAVAVG
jgi:hypothetical protein